MLLASITRVISSIKDYTQPIHSVLCPNSIAIDEKGVLFAFWTDGIIEEYEGCDKRIYDVNEKITNVFGQFYLRARVEGENSTPFIAPYILKLYSDHRRISENAHYNKNIMFRMLYRFVGKPLSDFIAHLDYTEAPNRGAYLAHWRKACEENETDLFLKVITRDANTFPSGFSVPVLLKTSYSFQEQREIIREKKHSLLSFTIKELNQSKRFAGKMPFYRPTEIIVTRNNTAEVFFEFKEGLKKAVEGTA